jgi:proton-dependent oligopeptide transporter, POT family
MLLGLVIYIVGGRYLPNQERVAGKPPPATAPAPDYRSTFALLFAIGLAVTVFRGAYEQVGNTVALWADVGVNRTTSLITIPMTWFQSLNPLLVFLMTPLLLAHWRRQADAGRGQSSMRKMATGALLVAGAYLLLSAVSFEAAPGRASWMWLALFFGIFTLGELHILPTGLGLFARLAPAGFGATTVAAWFLAIFSGSLTAGALGALWGKTTHARFFLLLTAIAALAAVMLLALDRTTRRIETARERAPGTSSAIQSECS